MKSLGIVGASLALIFSVVGGYLLLRGDPRAPNEAQSVSAPCPQCPICETPTGAVAEKRMVLDPGASTKERCENAERTVQQLTADLAAMDAELKQMSAQVLKQATGAR